MLNKHIDPQVREIAAREKLAGQRQLKTFTTIHAAQIHFQLLLHDTPTEISDRSIDRYRHCLGLSFKMVTTQAR